MTVAAVSSRGRNLALLAALLGWMFDGMEMGLFPLVGKDALHDLLGASASQSDVDRWYGIALACFLVGAATGGVVFGWLGDRIGRVRAMTVSVLLYSLSSGITAASSTAAELSALRFVGALGMGGEWALGVALVMELWPNASRAWLAGWIGAFGNFGYCICGLISLGLKQADMHAVILTAGFPADWASALTANGHWRLLMLAGAVPAFLTLFIWRLVPESEKWLREKEAGAASYWSSRDLLGVLVGAAAAGGVIVLWGPVDLHPGVRIAGSLAGLVVVIVGYLMPAQGYLSRSGMTPQARRQTLGRMLLAAGLSGVPLLGTWAGLMWMYQWVGKFPNVPADFAQEAKAYLQIVSALSASFGCVLAAVLGGRWGRRPVYAGLCLLSMGAMVGFYSLNTAYNAAFLISGGFLSLVSAAFYGWLPLYLPELFPTSVRATGQGFGFNFGRIIAAAGNLQMANLLGLFDNDYAKACSVVAGIYVVGLILIAVAPETKGKPLPE